MRQFRVLAGSHEEKGKEYNKGDIVPSSRDLCAAFVNKFEEVHAVRQIVEEPAPAPKTPPAGENPAKASETAPAGTGEAAPGTKKAIHETVESELGEDCTGDFDVALSAELKVFRKGKKYYVAQPDTVNKALNEDPLAQKEVAAFIAKALHG